MSCNCRGGPDCCMRATNYYWYAPVDMNRTTLTYGYCATCSAWWMGGHTCPSLPSPEDERFRALIREAVREAMREYRATFDRLADE